MAQPKRVILRIREAEINDEDLYEAVRVYFQASGHPVEGLNERRHFIHIQPSNPDIPQNDPKIHIVMDLEKNAYSGVLGDDFPHDLYRIHRIDGQMRLCAFRDGP
ncbi:hypothetical protein BJX76DRAFT_357183 [Aspergillus varians]